MSLRKVGTHRLVKTLYLSNAKWYVFEVPGVPFTRFMATSNWFWHGSDHL